MVNFKDIATDAGVSIATVSYYINNSRRLRPETRERIRSSIQRLGYTKNVMASNLALNRSPFYGLVVSDIQNPFFAEFAKAFHYQIRISPENKEMLVLDTDYDSRQMLNCADRLVGLRVNGAAFFTSETNPAAIAMLAEKEVCVVYTDVEEIGPYRSSIIIDYTQGMQQAIQHLRDLGHEHIGFISGPSAFRSIEVRKTAFMQLMGNASPQAVMETDGSFQSGYFAFSKMLGISSLTAVICGNDMLAIGAVHCAYDRGLNVPRDFSVVGFDNIASTEFTQPPLTTVAIPRDRISSIAYHAITEMIDDDNHTGRKYDVETKLIVRQSTAPPSPR